MTDKPLSDRLRTTFPPVSGAGPITTAQRLLVEEAAAEIERLNISNWDEHMRVLSENTRLRTENEALRGLVEEAANELNWFLAEANNAGREGPPRVWRLVSKLRSDAARSQS